MNFDVEAANVPVVCLMGPTAAGKTDLAIALRNYGPFEIVSVDSAQIYRDMDIGTGKPDAETLKRAPHRLIDILDPVERYSAARFVEDAHREIAEIRAQGSIPLLVGGTMLYFKALRDGLAAVPEASPAIRADIEALAETEGWPAVHQALQQVDPVSAARIHPNDPQRLQRALEVYRVSGQPLSQWHQQQTQGTPCGPVCHISVQPRERARLHEKIARRFHLMLDAGRVAEVEQLYARKDLDPSLPSIRSVGYRQVWHYLCGEYSYDEMVEKGIIATRQLAKRQVTWLRSWGAVSDFDSESAETLGEVLKLLRAASIK